MKDEDGYSGDGISPDSPNMPKAAKLGIRTLVVMAAGAMADETGNMPNSHKIAFQVMRDAYTGGDKGEALELLQKATEQERREIASIYSLMLQFCRQAIKVVCKASILEKDNFVHDINGDKGTLWLGDGPIPEDQKEEHVHGPDCVPPEAQLIKSLLESLGMNIEVEAVSEEEFEALSKKGKIRRLQDDYEAADDPISQIARRLNKMPGSKQPKLPPKKLPEC